MSISTITNPMNQTDLLYTRTGKAVLGNNTRAKVWEEGKTLETDLTMEERYACRRKYQVALETIGDKDSFDYLLLVEKLAVLRTLDADAEVRYDPSKYD